MLKLADLAVRGLDEPLPKVTIHLPPTPSVETPATPTLQSPSLRIIPKTKPTAKPMERKASLIISTPSTPVGTGPPKLRLMAPSAAQISAHGTPAHAPHAPPAKISMPPPTGPVPKKKEKPLPKAQSGGMSANDLKACRNAL